MEEWIMKKVEFAEMAKLACLNREGAMNTFY